MWEFPIRLKAAFPGLPLICDPSHIGGHPDRLGEIAQQALDLNFSGLMVETHRDPEHARSDAQQQITPAALAGLLDSLIFREALPGSHLRDELQEYRDLIDQLDEEIAQKLGARMDIAERIGEFKRAHNVAILQPERWERVLARQRALCLRLGLDTGFVDEFMAAIHNESIRRQSAVPSPQPASGSRGSATTGGEAVDG
jgi:chorismate mutase